MSDGQQRDWFKTWLHFFCGLVVGGLPMLWQDFDWISILAVALLAGVLAAIYLDRFWEWFLDWWSWWW